MVSSLALIEPLRDLLEIGHERVHRLATLILTPGTQDRGRVRRDGDQCGQLGRLPAAPVTPDPHRGSEQRLGRVGPELARPAGLDGFPQASQGQTCGNRCARALIVDRGHLIPNEVPGS